MPNPWDRPTKLVRGDLRRIDVYAAVGHVSSAWEDLEVSLSHLFAALRSEWPYNPQSYLPYGSKIGFKDRVEGLERQACVYSRANPNQHIEGELLLLFSAARGFSQRRNEVIHGIVRPFALVASAGTPEDPIRHTQDWTYCLTPPHYTQRKYTHDNMPEYLYSSVEMAEIHNHLVKLKRVTDDLVEAISGFSFVQFPTSGRPTST